MSLLSDTSQTKLKKYLVDEHILNQSDIDKITADATKQGESFVSLLIKNNYLDNELLTKYLALINKVPYVNLTKVYVNEKILDYIPQDLAQNYMAVPIGIVDGKLAVAMLEADNIQAIDFLTTKIGRPIDVYSASEEGIRNILKQYKVNITDKVINQFTEDNETTNKDQNNIIANSKIKTIPQDSPVSKILTSILEYAANNRASDVHIEPTEHILRIRARVDGILREIMQLPKNIEPALVSRIKILANLKIDEHRIPQDGDFSILVSEKKIDLRISISPIVWGEQIVIRLLDKTGISLLLDDMGYTGRALRAIRSGISASNGMILTSGPTGSGKTTSLYALLSEVKSDAVNIVTMEDPVEYKISGINQIQVNPEVGLTFASGLRSILRQDPDIVMVGEIRDNETAELAIQAALTGHLVFSTLHTNSAAGILPRLLDMGIEPFLIASTIKTVIGQRLIRTIGEKKEEYSSNEVENAAITQTVGKLLPSSKEQVDNVSNDLGYKDLPLSTQNAYTLSRGIDSPDSPNGFKGRTGIFEAFEVTPTIQDLILKRATSTEIQNKAQEEGMITMRQDGYLKALKGLTTLQEVDRVASSDKV